MDPVVERLRHAPLTHLLHALAAGVTTSQALTEACLAAIAAEAGYNAWLHLDAEGARRAARDSDRRRAAGQPLGRLDGVPLALRDGVDVAGWPGTLGLRARIGAKASDDAAVVTRLRGAGAVLLGSTAIDEVGFGATGRNAQFGDVRHPHTPDRVCGGSSAGAAVAVARGHAAAALGIDTLGSVRIPAAFCGVVGLRPTFGEVSGRGLAPGLRRVDCPGLFTRAVADVVPLLQVLAGYDPGDPRSRRRRVPLQPPDWSPGTLRAGVVGDLSVLGTAPEVVATFESAVRRAAPVFGTAAPVSLYLAAFEIGVTRRAALLLMEAEILAAHADAIAHVSPAVRHLLAFAEGRSAVDAARADRRLDRHVVQVRRLFEQFDVLLIPTSPVTPPRTGDAEPHTIADFAALASLAGCPALTLPLSGGVGLELVGQPGSDLRLLELGEILLAVLGGGE